MIPHCARLRGSSLQGVGELSSSLAYYACAASNIVQMNTYGSCSDLRKEDLVQLESSMLHRIDLDCKICQTIVTDVVEDLSLTRETTDAELASALDAACTELNEREGFDCHSFLDSYEDELIPQVQSLGEDRACLAVEVCKVDENSG